MQFAFFSFSLNNVCQPPSRVRTYKSPIFVFYYYVEFIVRRTHFIAIPRVIAVSVFPGFLQVRGCTALLSLWSEARAGPQVQFISRLPQDKSRNLG